MLEQGLGRLVRGYGMDEGLEVVVVDLIPIVQGTGERQSESMLLELAVCVAPCPI